MNKSWYYADKGQPAGPFSLEGLRSILKDIPSWRDTLVRREGDDEWQKAGGFSELQMFRLTPPPPPSTKIAGDGHVSRKTTFWLITLYFMGALGFHFYLRMSRPFAKIDYQSVAEAFGAALGLVFISGTLPMIIWAFRRFRSEAALVPMAVRCILLLVLASLVWRGTQVQREGEIEQIGKTVFTGKQREEMMRLMTNGCIESLRKTPAITGEQVKAYCGCTAAAVAIVVTGDEMAYAAKNNAYPPSMLQKLTEAAPRCVHLLSK